MKRIKTFFAATVLCAAIATTFVSCSEKEDEPVTPAAKSIAGVYCGDMTSSVMGSESVIEDVMLTVAATDDATASITVSSFGEPPMQVASITIPGIAVSGADGVYTLATTAFSGTTDTGKAYSGTAQGSFADNRLTLQWNLTYGAMPMPMIFTFSAPKE